MEVDERIKELKAARSGRVLLWHRMSLSEQ
jgi:hypothetical protein